jgi:hypothetical protein
MFTNKRLPPVPPRDVAELWRGLSEFILSLEQPDALEIESAQIKATNGIEFPATQNPSDDLNTLDDYEEITSWTPSLGGTATYTNRYGRSVKIGKLVIAWGRIEVNVLGTGSATTISGLPYTMGATTIGHGGNVYYFANLPAAVASITPIVLPSTATITFSSIPAAGAVSMTYPTTVFQNSAIVNFTVIYEAAD